jgi:hypothetical protein
MIWAGGGVQFLDLPDIRFTGKGDPGDFHRQENSDFSEYGGSAGGGLQTALGYWWGYRVTGGVKGFWSNVDGDDTVGCRTGCVVVDPTGTVTASGQSFAPRPTAMSIIGAGRQSSSSAIRSL